MGALLLASPISRQIALEGILLAELISSALAGAAYGGRLAETLTRRNEQLTMVADIAAHVSSSLETREVYRLVVQKLNEYFKVEAGSLLLSDEATDELIFVMTLEGGEEKLFGMRLPPGAGRGRPCRANPAGVYHQRCRKRPAALQAERRGPRVCRPATFCARRW